MRKEQIASLRKAHQRRRSRARGTDRRHTLPNRTSIHGRPIEVAARQVVGHWESDLIKGAGNRSAVGTLIERKSRYLLAHQDAAEPTLEAFAQRCRHVASYVRKSLTDDQGREMACRLQGPA